MPTPHIEAKKGEIAKFVLMPGDPLRAKVMSEKFLENPKLVNKVRNMFMYTGTYKGMEITIAASGMGNPSMGIYSYELYNEYGVENIIRVGTCGAYNKDYRPYSIFNTKDSFGESQFAKIVTGKDEAILPASKQLYDAINQTAEELGIPMLHGRAHASDVFYRSDDSLKLAQEKHLDVAEMETYALFANALRLQKQAGALFTVSDNIVTGEVTTSEERQTKFVKMFEVALETALKFKK
ncbi:purine nucleoside phosphorylase [Williamsoniiplasma luminosum]|uniref:Uridine phosphorylase n=1 Tax=Williamsoniiplasma luminosum TaxID=214888 RepID=A0A2K8NTQ2_9MOLU|nr:purine-nucleoside phosphorylase [Williamsoniiplasma luminosum]ATZ17169.1 purine nucleoside phosphorylase [Williamsoniiplasma luminosum]AVP49034.1 MAG: purine-nucleoside phosphorylase [Williamsoniiplasma luminosum]